MVNSEEGRFALAAKGLNPYLVRLSLGAEPAASVLSTIERALDALDND